VKKDIKKVAKVKAEEEDKVVRKQTKKVKDEEAEAQFKWWEQSNEDEDGSVKWNELEHNGVLFPPAYVPHGVKMKYDGKPISLSPEAEEVASFFAALIETDHGKNPVFQKNFFSDWQEILAKDSSVRIES
jgi:DNA topoisomerase-1